MNAETLHDAISLLPEALLTDVDRLRRKKSVPWRSIAALAACLCMVAGLWTLGSGGIKAESGSSAPENYYANDASKESATGHSITEPMSAVIVQVLDDRITVLPGDVLTDIAQPITVMLTELEDTPALAENQRIVIYCEEYTDPLVPYRIEIIAELKEETQ